MAAETGKSVDACRMMIRRYEHSPGKLKQMREDQCNCCAICGNGGKLVCDHDHASGKLRGLLCHKCNSGLGMFRDSVRHLQAAIEYLGRGINPTQSLTRVGQSLESTT